MKILGSILQRSAPVAAPLAAALGRLRPAWDRVMNSAFLRDSCPAMTAGALLFGIAAAGLGARGGFAAFRVDTAAAGATVSVGWGYLWLGLALGGAATGALVGAGAAYAGRRWLDAARAGAALLAVGALGGVLAGATWGNAVARERVVELRARQASAPSYERARGPRVSVVNGPVRLEGTVTRAMNVPLLAFMLIGGTAVGLFTARGLREPLRFPRREEKQPILDDIGRARFQQAA